MMEISVSDLERRVASRLRALRAARALSLEALARQSGVSRSMISLIERAETSATANVLDRLAAGLGVTLASLFAEEERDGAAPVARRAEQNSWSDPETGYIRRNLSPPGFESSLELVEVVLPAGCRVAYDAGSRLASVDQQIYVLSGTVEIRIGEQAHDLAQGDCLAMRLDRPIMFQNTGATEARYVVALSTDPMARPRSAR